MKKKFGLACATLVAMSLMACSEDSTNTITNTESLLASSASVGEELGGDPALNPDVNPDVPGEEVPGNENVNPGIPGEEVNPGENVNPGVPGEEVVPGGEVVPGEPGEEVNPGIPGEEPNPTSSNSDPTPASSDSEPVIESSSEVALGPTEKTYAFGYALKNAARPSKGCGKNSTLVKTKSVENGDRFEMMVEGQNREYFITCRRTTTIPSPTSFSSPCTAWAPTPKTSSTTSQTRIIRLRTMASRSWTPKATTSS